MKQTNVFFIVLCFSIFVYKAAQSEDNNKYIGVKQCSMCHKSESKGNQYKKWQESKHSQAYNVLDTLKAKEIAKVKGIDKNPQESEECLQCHATAFGVSSDMIVEGKELKIEDGVQCESCHGAGEKFFKISIMRDKDKAISKGLLIPDEETCIKCHNEEGHGWREFNYEESYRKIRHLDINVQ